MTSQRIQRLRSQSGYTFIDLLTSCAIFAVIAAAGLPHLNTRRQDIQNTTRQVIADYRWARARAITSGTHFSLNWTSDNAYEVRRLKQVGTAWNTDAVVKHVELPATISRSGSPDNVEYNTRGMMISSESMEQQRLWDLEHETERVIAIWPSGQTTEYAF
jgi:Tfp pilus assembly protein FimT